MLILFGVGYLLYHLYGKKIISQGPKGLVKPGLMLLLGIVVLAVATGRANAIFALIGGLVAAAWRLAPLLMRFYPQIRQLMDRFGVQATGGSTGSSKVNTATLSMSLDHKSGRIDGDIIAGQFMGRTLSSLSFDELKTLHAICQKQDVDALRLLEAFIQREYPETKEQWSSSGQQSGTNNDPNMSIDEAWDILGLTPNSSKEEIINSHRKLMSRLHPDKGGSTFLAARVNQAKDRLLANLNKSG